MSVFANSTKINPKQRILHRLTYRLEGKIKKIYYNVFIKLENIKKNAQKEAKKEAKDAENGQQQVIDAEKGQKKIKTKNIENAVEKLNQVNSILFSKYFEHVAKRSVFMLLKYVGHYQAGL